MPQVTQESTVPLDKLIKNFETALSTQSGGIIKYIWDENPKVRAWYCGQQVDFSKNEFGQPDMRTVSDDDLLSNFNSILAGRMAYVIQAAWDGNVRLQQLVKGLNSYESIEILNNVLNFLPKDSAFIDCFVSWMENVSAIRAVLEERQAQITLLQNRLAISQHPPEDHSSIKHGAPDQSISSPSKRQRISEGSESNPNDVYLILPDNPVVSSALDILINSFKSALKEQNTDVIKAKWEEHSLLRSWFCGNPVGFGPKESGEVDIRTISFDDLSANFELALTSGVSCVYKRMWNSSKLHRYYRDQGTELGIDESGKPVRRNAHLGEINTIFELALSSNAPYIIKVMWKGSTMLRRWYAGVQFDWRSDGDEEADLRSISAEDLIIGFKSVLANRVPCAIKGMWDTNQLLREWCRGQQVDFGKNGQHDIRKVSDHALIRNFKSVLAGRVDYVIQAMWDGNERLQQLIKNLDSKMSIKMLNKVLSSLRNKNDSFITQYVNFIDIHTILSVLHEKKANVRHKIDVVQISILQARIVEIQGIPQTILPRQEIQLEVLESNPQNEYSIAPESPAVSYITDAMIKAYKSSLELRDIKVCKAMWNDNPMLRAYYSDQGAQLGINGVRQSASLDELHTVFKLVMSRRLTIAIKDIWDENALFCAWYKGQKVDVGKNGQSDMRETSDSELISNFKHVLASRKPYLIEAMWDENDRLKKAIKDLYSRSSIQMLKSVLASAHGRNAFIIQYVNWLDKADVISAVLEASGSSKRYIAQIPLLQKRLDTILAALQTQEAPAAAETIYGGATPPPTFFRPHADANNSGAVVDAFGPTPVELVEPELDPFFDSNSNYISPYFIP